MPCQWARCTILIIRLSPDLAVVLIWIRRCPYQYIGRGLILRKNGTGTRVPTQVITCIT